MGKIGRRYVRGITGAALLAVLFFFEANTLSDIAILNGLTK